MYSSKPDIVPIGTPATGPGIRVSVTCSLYPWNCSLSLNLQFSPSRTDVLGDHWNRNRSPNPPGHSSRNIAAAEMVHPMLDVVPTITLRQYKKSERWKAFLSLAQDLILGHILLECAFPSPDDLKTAIGECIGEALSIYPRLHPDFPLDYRNGNFFLSRCILNDFDIHPQ